MLVKQRERERERERERRSLRITRATALLFGK